MTLEILIPKTQPIRSDPHRRFIASLPCLRCGTEPCQAAHVRIGWLALGKKPPDRHCVPLCQPCHEAQHLRGDERAWWADTGINPTTIAMQLFAVSRNYGAGWNIVRQARMAA